MTVTTERLLAIPALQDVPAAQLEWLIAGSQEKWLARGDFMFETGEPIAGMQIVIDGRIRMYLLQNSEARELLIFEPDAITGYLPFSRGMTAPASAQAITAARLLFLPKEKIPEMIQDHFELTQALVHVMTNRVRDFTAFQQQNEKMMALGKLSAGLAHELNNPASAIVRSASSLKKHLLSAPKTFKDIIEIKMSAEQAASVSAVIVNVLTTKIRPALTLMERSHLEDEMTDWMVENKVTSGLEIAENFVDHGLTLSELTALKTQVPAVYISSVMAWINNNIVTEKMVIDIEEASTRIADLVGSVKTFTHMDQGHDKQYADIHTGIRNTLIMLNHKIHKSAVAVTETFDTSLPPVKAMIGELNQVWTNLIDNALDALEFTHNPALEIITKRDNQFVEVSVIDNGPGIPDNVASRIFDPFFTTKEIGKGTGLGLDVVRRIVTQHQGSVKISSVPGRTAFIVCFPIDG
jgi:signal transduction histidine kinase